MDSEQTEDEVRSETSSESSYDEQFFPARPRRLRPTARRRTSGLVSPPEHGDQAPTSETPGYVNWLVERSMLHYAKNIAQQLSGTGIMWQNPFARPDPRAAGQTASVWFTAYPMSLINSPGTSFLATLGDDNLWTAFQQIGIEAVHTGPVKAAGGLRGWRATSTVDGHFDRISTEIDPMFGTAEEYRDLCSAAATFGGIIIDDIVPGHTGKGADFRLAEMGYEDYPGIYHMVEVDPADWSLLPDIPAGADSKNIGAEAEANLAAAGYIVGALQRVIFFAEGVKETNWSATDVVRGVDGVERRWVYLHYFKEGQPSINWLDPSFSGMRLVIGDALHSLTDLGAGALRLDANGFLGVEKSAEGSPAWSEGHPLSDAANQLIASMVRKVGAFTFQELNLSIDDIKVTSEAGADLSYDFITRPAYQHALATGDTEFLRLTLREGTRNGIDTAALVHALQNHDELTYELVHFTDVHARDEYAFRGQVITGGALADLVRRELTERLTAPLAPYNLPFTQNGIACTTASIATAALGLAELDRLTSEDIEQVRRIHLLLVMYNAMQPGVLALSGWDLCGILPIDPSLIGHLLSDGDTRWIHRGAHDLMGLDPQASESAAGMPRGRSLYGTVPEQLADEHSFISGLRGILATRARLGIATGRQLDVPDVSHPGLLVMVHEVGEGLVQATVLNFAREAVAGTVRSDFFPAGSVVVDSATDEPVGDVDNLHAFGIALNGFQGMSVLVLPANPSA
jgi:trehalose synthase